MEVDFYVFNLLNLAFVLNLSQLITNPLAIFVLNRSRLNARRFCLALIVLNRSRFNTNARPFLYKIILGLIQIPWPFLY